MKQEHLEQIDAAVKALEDRANGEGIDRIYFVACGGSQAFFMPVQYMFDRELGVPTAIYNSNEFNYGTPKAFGPKSVVITCSHSGTTPETVAAAQKATDAGALSIAFTNVADSPLWKAATRPMHYDHGKDADLAEKNTSVLYTFVFKALKVLAPEQSARWDNGLDAIVSIAPKRDAAIELYRERAEKFATANKRQKTIYTMASGVNYGEAYSTANCWFMEMQWVSSNPIHSGEYFHGPFEITDYGVPFIIIVSNGATRQLDERALAFAEKFSDDLLVIDQRDFDYTGIDEANREYLAPVYSAAVVRTFVEKLAHDRGHSLDVRRYMWQMQY